MCLFGAIRNNTPMQIGVLNIVTLPTIKAKEWKCEKHSQQWQQDGKSKLCNKISNANNSIVSNGCFYERLNQIKPNLIDLLCIGIARMRERISNQIDRKQNATNFRSVSYVTKNSAFRIVSSIFRFHSVNHQVEFIYM